MTTQPEFNAFPKIARLSKDCIITEKIDGTNAQVHITDDGSMLVGSRKRWITPEADNFGFAAWCRDNKEELLKLGPGRHFGEWWGSGIQRGYGLDKDERRLSLFNVERWCLHGKKPEQIPYGDPRIEKYQEMLPECVGLVPVIMRDVFDTRFCDDAINTLKTRGSLASHGYMNPEGIVCFHVAANICFKKTIVKDEQPKGKY